MEAELKEIGLTEVTIDEFGYLTGTLESNTEKEMPVIAFISHMDTAPDYSGKTAKLKFGKTMLKRFNFR